MIIPVYKSLQGFELKPKTWTGLNALHKGREDLRHFRMSYPAPLGICKLCSLLELEHIQAFGAKVLTGRVRDADWNTETLPEGWHFGWNLGNKREVWCLLRAVDASVSIPTRNTLCYKQQTHLWVLEWFEGSRMLWIPLLFIVLAGESEGTPFH